MNRITLNRLSLRNFKGCREFDLILNGQSATITGDNGTGKSTLMDGFLWLLFDKDSQGKKDFQVKTVTPDGQEIHNLEHSVEAELTVNGEVLTLGKCLKEKWTKKRGELTAEFSGHTTDYFVNGVPKPLKEFKAAVESVIPEDTFRLLTSPAHFNGLDWKKRRELLLQVCGDVSDATVIEQTPELSALTAILGSHSVDDQRAIIKASQKKINESLTTIPARIDELRRSIAQTAEYDRDLIQAHIDVLDQQIATVKDSTSDAALRQERSSLMLKYQELTNKRLQDQTQASNARTQAITNLRNKIATRSADYARGLKEQAAYQTRINNLEASLTSKRAAYKALAAQQAEEGKCPLGFACEHPDFKLQVEAGIAKFNEDKARLLAANMADGKATKKVLDGEKESLAACIIATDAAKAEVESLQAELIALESKPVDSTHPLDAEIESVKAKVATLTAKIEAATSEAPDTTALEAEKQTESDKIAALNAATTSQTRIAELQAEEKRLTAEFEKLTGQLYLCEQFTVAKVKLLEDSINSRFSLAKFKMFDTQINGGIAECCTTLVNGVPYGQGLNKGAEINVGLDIVDTLSGHYGMSAPVFIDNSESVTRLYGLGSQMIKLKVCESAKSLVVTLD